MGDGSVFLVGGLKVEVTGLAVMGLGGHATTAELDLAILCVFDGLGGWAAIDNGDDVLGVVALDAGRNQLRFH